MTPELQAATERQRQHLAITGADLRGSPYWTDGGVNDAAYYRDVFALRDAFLATPVAQTDERRGAWLEFAADGRKVVDILHEPKCADGLSDDYVWCEERLPTDIDPDAALVLLEAAREMYQALRDYEIDADGDPTHKHRRMMGRAQSAIDAATPTK